MTMTMTMTMTIIWKSVDTTHIVIVSQARMKVVT